MSTPKNLLTSTSSPYEKEVMVHSNVVLQELSAPRDPPAVVAASERKMPLLVTGIQERTEAAVPSTSRGPAGTFIGELNPNTRSLDDVLDVAEEMAVSKSDKCGGLKRKAADRPPADSKRQKRALPKKKTPQPPKKPQPPKSRPAARKLPAPVRGRVGDKLVAFRKRCRKATPYKLWPRPAEIESAPSSPEREAQLPSQGIGADSLSHSPARETVPEMTYSQSDAEAFTWATNLEARMRALSNSFNEANAECAEYDSQCIRLDAKLKRNDEERQELYRRIQALDARDASINDEKEKNLRIHHDALAKRARYRSLLQDFGKVLSGWMSLIPPPSPPT